MADSNCLAPSFEHHSQHTSASTHFIIDDSDDDDDRPSDQLPSMSLNPADDQSNLSAAQFGLGEDDDAGPAPSFLLDFVPAMSVPIQRVSSEDELNFYVKPKRAKFVGPYLFGDVIGHGSYAKVKECLDRRSLSRRAVKIMQRRRLRKTPHGEEMALTEIRLLKEINHPNIIRLYDFLRNDEKQKLYLFIDLCVVSLQEMLDAGEGQKEKKKVFPVWQAHGYFVQLINGLEYLHSKLIIHNDIKPGNLLITVDHQLKITDFGTAEQLNMFSPDDTIKRSQGTPAFQCPEIANGEDTYSGFSIDIWSSGVTLYNLVTGILPFEADNIYLLFQTIGRGVYTIPDDLDAPLAALLTGLLHADKHFRFSMKQIKEHDWFRRRPPRTFDFLAIPSTALNRFQTCTMLDYLTDLHRSSTNNDDQPMNFGEGVNTFYGKQARLTTRSTLNCTCSRTVSGENMHQIKSKTTREARRLCSLS